MEENNIGVSLTKILEEGELLAQNIDRGVQVCKNKKTLEAVNKVVKKVNGFYNKIKDIKFSGDSLKSIINVLKTISPALQDLKVIKDSIVNIDTNVKVNPSL
jgi:vacuolar-type H+-ATPase subunit E/Vma4